jgi:tagaturonate reductase
MTLQFGAGKFLRAFYDLFVQEMKDGGNDLGPIIVAQSTGGDRAGTLNNSGGSFPVWVRGIENGVPIERVQMVGTVKQALVIGENWTELVKVAIDPTLHTIISNTTEAGMVLSKEDKIAADKTPQTPPHSFPARLLALLRARWEVGQAGVLVVPCELIADNARILEHLVLEQAAIWGWTETDFTDWLTKHCAWAGTLVDRIVSGTPAECPTTPPYNHPLLTVCEPYAVFVIENKPGTERLIHPAILRVPDVAPYALRKVRILNGAHTALVTKIARDGRTDLTYVREAMQDAALRSWLEALLWEEIVPTIADRVDDAEGYAKVTLDRFSNPFLDHRLADIRLHHETKVQTRLIPTQDEYRAKFGKEATKLREILT